jgi:hypothetical protein
MLYYLGVTRNKLLNAEYLANGLGHLTDDDFAWAVFGD